ncbi:MAG: aminotransferase class I/II-fold pyridoxal phosphate-dependent enzyme [Gemmatimonadota bacterium]
MRYTPFRMERWQSTYEHRVEINLSESGVHPLTVSELIELSGREIDLGSTLLGYGQSNGSDELRALIADQYTGAGDDSVLVTVGGAEANFTCFWHLFEGDAKAAIVLPTYGQVPGLLESFGSRLMPVHLREETGWQPDIDALEDALEAGASFVLITNPNNPTGAALSTESMRAIADLTAKHGAWILSDEVYAGAETGEERTPSFWGVHDRVLVTNSLSKAYGLPGLRLGWIMGPSELVEELWGRTDYTTIAPASVSDQLACAALQPDARERIGTRTRSIVRKNLGVLEQWMGSQDGRFRYQPPDAGAICYTHYDAPINSSDFAEKLRVEHSLLIVPGDHFGMDHYMRLGFGNPEDELLEGLGRIRAAFDEVTTGVA